MSERLIEAAGHKIWYEAAGEGSVVLLMHAGATDSSMWDSTWAEFASRFRAVRIDLPGAGRSPFPETPWEPVTLIESILDSLGIASAAMVGVSLSGSNAIDFTIQHPDRVWALVAVASGPRVPPGAAAPDERQMALMQAIAAGDLATAAGLFLELWSPLRTDAELDGRIRDLVERNVIMLTEVSQGLAVIPDWPVVERLGEVAVPTLAIWGDADFEGIGKLARLLVSRVEGARGIELPGVDHFVPMRAPQAFVDAAIPFLEDVRPR